MPIVAKKKGKFDMGDRCCLTISIHGHFETASQFDAVERILDENALWPEWKLSCAGAFLHGAEDWCVNFTDEECNFADISMAEKQLQSLGVHYYVSHDGGSNYGPACWSWGPDCGKHSAITDHDGGSVVSVNRLTKALNGGEPLAAIREMVSNAMFAEGVHLPQLTLSHSVSEYLAKKEASMKEATS
jgi:hypothetical protein